MCKFTQKELGCQLNPLGHFNKGEQGKVGIFTGIFTGLTGTEDYGKSEVSLNFLKGGERKL